MDIAIRGSLADPGWRARRFVELLAFGIMLCCYVPRLSVAVLAVLGLAALTFPAARARMADAFREPRASLVLPFVLLAYLLMNAAWAVDPGEAYSKVGSLVLLSLCVLAVMCAVSSLDNDVMRYAHVVLAIGLTAGLVGVAIGWFSDRAGARLLYSLFPDLQPENNKWLKVEDGWVIKAGKWELNRHMGVLALFAWVAVLATIRGFREFHGKWLAAAFLIAIAAVVGVSHHQASQVALAGSAIVFALSILSTQVVRRALAFLWCAAFLIVVPVADYAYTSLSLHEAQTLPRSARARVIIWGETAARIQEKPWLGVGIRSTRHIDRPVTRAQLPAGQVFGKRTGRHAHNIYLQTWFELGFVGVVLTMSAVLMLFLAAAGLPAIVGPYVNAAFAMFAIQAAFSWGLWQSWLLAIWGLMVICLFAAGRIWHRTG